MIEGKPWNWAQLIMELRENLGSFPATLQLCATALEELDWDVAAAERALRLQGWGDRA